VSEILHFGVNAITTTSLEMPHLQLSLLRLEMRRKRKSKQKNPKKHFIMK